MKHQTNTNPVIRSGRLLALAIWLPVQALMANQMGGTNGGMGGTRGGMGGTNGWMGGGMWIWMVVIAVLVVVLLAMVINRRSKK